MWQIGSYLCRSLFLDILFLATKHIPKGNKGLIWSGPCLTVHSSLTALHSVAWSCAGCHSRCRQCEPFMFIPPHLLNSILYLETASTILRVDNVDCAEPQPSSAHAGLCSVLVSRHISGSLECFSVYLECFFHPTSPQPEPLLPGLADSLSSESNLSLNVTVQGTLPQTSIC